MIFDANCSTKQDAKQHNLQERESRDTQSDYECVIEELSKKPNGLVRDDTYIDQQVRLYTMQRKERIRTFVKSVKKKREDYLLSLCPQFDAISS